MLTHTSGIMTLGKLMMSLYIATISSVYGLDNFNGKLEKLKKKYKNNKDKISKTYSSLDESYNEAKGDIDNIKDKSKKINGKINNKKNTQDNNKSNNKKNNNYEDLESSNSNDNTDNEYDEEFNDDYDDDTDENLEEIFNSRKNKKNNKKYKFDQKLIIDSDNINNSRKIMSDSEKNNMYFIILLILELLFALISIIISFIACKVKKNITLFKILLISFSTIMYSLNVVVILLSNEFLSYPKIMLLKDFLLVLSTLFIGFIIGKSTYSIVIDNTELP